MAHMISSPRIDRIKEDAASAVERALAGCKVVGRHVDDVGPTSVVAWGIQRPDGSVEWSNETEFADELRRPYPPRGFVERAFRAWCEERWLKVEIDDDEVTPDNPQGES